MTTLHERAEQTPSTPSAADASAEPMHDPYKMDFVKTGGRPPRPPPA